MGRARACSSVVSLVRVDNLRRSATRGSRADEGVRPTFVPAAAVAVVVVLAVALAVALVVAVAVTVVVPVALAVAVAAVTGQWPR